MLMIRNVVTFQLKEKKDWLHSFGETQRTWHSRSRERNDERRLFPRAVCLRETAEGIRAWRSESRWIGLRSFRRGNVNFVRGHELNVRHFSFQSHVSVAWFLISVRKKRKFVLMIEPICELIQERCESNWRIEALEVRFAPGLVGEPRQVVLSLIDSPETMAKMPGA